MERDEEAGKTAFDDFQDHDSQDGRSSLPDDQVGPFFVFFINGTRLYYSDQSQKDVRKESSLTPEAV
jgi:hypothetical protein